MSRATVWAPLCDLDPTPGDPDQVTKAGRRYSEMAKEIEDQVRRLNGFVSGTLQGGYVQSLTNAAEGLKNDLGLTSKRYREVGGALQQWAPQLDDFQDEAERLRQEAVTAQGDMWDNRASPQLRAVDSAPPPDAQVAADKARQGRYDDARGDLSRVQSRLADLSDRRDAAAARIADAIRETCDDAVANSAWDSFKDWMDDHHELVSGICDVLGVIAMVALVVALVVPGLNVVAAGVLTGIVVGATTGKLIGHTMLASTDHGSWGDVALDVVDLATLGQAGLAARAAKKVAEETTAIAAAKAAEKAAAAAAEKAPAIAAQEAATAVRVAEEAALAALPELRGSVAASFAKGEYSRVMMPAGRRFVRAEGANASKPGSFLGDEIVDSADEAETAYNLIKWNNPRDVMRTYELTEDVPMYYGKVAGGEGYQALIPKAFDPSLILRTISTRILP